MRTLRSCVVLAALSSLCSVARAQQANTQTDARDYEALAFLPNNTIAALGYFRHVSSSDSASFSQSLAVFRASYILKFGNLALVPFYATVPLVDVPVYEPTTTRHTSRL